MSVTTEADEELAAATSEIDRVVEHLSNIVIRRCYGFEGFSNEQEESLKDSLLKAMDIRDTLEEL